MFVASRQSGLVHAFRMREAFFLSDVLPEVGALRAIAIA
jgi:hypothetical protein